MRTALGLMGLLVWLSGCGPDPAPVSACPDGGAVTGAVDIRAAGALATMAGCTSVEGSLTVMDSSLTTLAGLESLTSVGGDLVILNNSALTNLDALHALTTVGAEVRVQDNAKLTSVGGLGALTSIPGSLMVYRNAALTTLSLASLTSVASGPLNNPHHMGPLSLQLYVSTNNAMTSLNLPALTFVGPNGLQIYDNAALPQCQADALATQLATTCNCDRNTGTAGCP
jgi:hypothetical protein